MQEEKNILEKLWKKAQRFAWVFALCPFVRMTAVCNSIAFEKVHDTSDIDLFVITTNNRLSIARFFMKLFTQLLGVRAHHKKTAGRFCLSFFVTEKAMDLQPLALEFDPHLAHFTKTMTPLFGEKTYKNFLEANSRWTFPYFQQNLQPRLDQLRPHRLAKLLQKILEVIVNIFGTAAEAWCENFLQKREKKYREKFRGATGVIINKNVFKFHKNDPRQKIAEEFAERFNDVT